MSMLITDKRLITKEMKKISCLCNNSRIDEYWKQGEIVESE